ncbi:hypothetical protein BOH78_5477 [Pichia kudriavzevii]|uniref:Uncharacterized protein n=2 Tax=Pichia kudriavzevii TaxID=4909 RepID=A0A1V2L956_PICKU|nr:hypothetical protein BOH78_5477 [Pichia kudriavzevii]
MDTHKYLEKQDLRTLLLVEFFNNKYSLNKNYRPSKCYTNLVLERIENVELEKIDVFELVPAKASNIEGFSN